MAQRAADSESLAVQSSLYETRLDNMLMDDDPQTAVADLLLEVNKLFEERQYNKVLPLKTPEMEAGAKNAADDLIARYRSLWQLTVKERRVVKKPAPETERQ